MSVQLQTEQSSHSISGEGVRRKQLFHKCRHGLGGACMVHRCVLISLGYPAKPMFNYISLLAGKGSLLSAVVFLSWTHPHLSFIKNFPLEVKL